MACSGDCQEVRLATAKRWKELPPRIQHAQCLFPEYKNCSIANLASFFLPLFSSPDSMASLFTSYTLLASSQTALLMERLPLFWNPHRMPPVELRSSHVERILGFSGRLTFRHMMVIIVQPGFLQS